MKDIVLVEHLEDVDLGVQEVGGYKCNVVHSTLTMLEIHAWKFELNRMKTVYSIDILNLTKHLKGTFLLKYSTIFNLTFLKIRRIAARIFCWKCSTRLSKWRIYNFSLRQCSGFWENEKKPIFVPWFSSLFFQKIVDSTSQFLT